MKKFGQKNRVIQGFRVIEGRVIEGFYCTRTSLIRGFFPEIQYPQLLLISSIILPISWVLRCGECLLTPLR